MFVTETQIRVRYGETDRMGVAYYGSYSVFYEVARTDMLRKIGLSYKEMEDKGIILPVIHLNVHYYLPALYDEMITIKTYMKNKPGVRIHFEYELFNAENKLINKGETTLAFVNKKTGRPTKAPEYFMEKIAAYFDLS